jgi:nitrogen fixation protein NifU and related proteins
VDNLYQAQILDRSKHPRFGGVIEQPTHQSEGANLSCGDEIAWTACIADDNKITELKHKTRACAVCAASADLLAEELQGKSPQEIQDWNTERVTEMLGIPLSPVRLKCALLPLEALKELRATD